MAYENPLGTNNLAIFEASTGLKQYQFVALNSAGKLVSPSTLGHAIGILVSSGTTGSTRDDTVQSVQVYGVGKVISGSSSIAIGDLVAADSDGFAIVATTANFAMGTALAAGASTSTTAEVIPVLLQHLGAISS
jgi:hypothetical protein